MSRASRIVARLLDAEQIREAPSLNSSRLCSERKPGDRRHHGVTCKFAQASKP